MRILVLGGDGFCGWPTSLRLSKNGHEVIIVDNLARRKIDVELEVQSLTPIQTLSSRLESWKKITGKDIGFASIDVAADYAELVQLISSFRPDSVIHFAEQKSAPYSMRSSWHKRYTVAQNTAATTNVMCALVESRVDAHVVHLGTMGVYGYNSAGSEIPEGYLKIFKQDKNGELIEDEILHPTYPGSVYHLTKSMDQLSLAFFNKNDNIRVTDLHQGIVWGTNTEETRIDESLINRFDYDGDFGTVLNRFLIQAACGVPLTVHGKGHQKRAFIHIQDTVKCIELAILNPPERQERVRIFNQMSEVFRVVELADLVSKMSGVPFQHLENPRKELETNELAVDNSGLRKLGFEPITLDQGLLGELIDTACRYRSRLDKNKVLSVPKW